MPRRLPIKLKIFIRILSLVRQQGYFLQESIYKYTVIVTAFFSFLLLKYICKTKYFGRCALFSCLVQTKICGFCAKYCGFFIQNKNVKQCKSVGKKGYINNYKVKGTLKMFCLLELITCRPNIDYLNVKNQYEI